MLPGNYNMQIIQFQELAEEPLEWISCLLCSAKFLCLPRGLEKKRSLVWSLAAAIATGMMVVFHFFCRRTDFHQTTTYNIDPATRLQAETTCWCCFGLVWWICRQTTSEYDGSGGLYLFGKR